MAGLQNVCNPASAACRQGPNFVGRNGSRAKSKRIKKRKRKKKEKKERNKRKTRKEMKKMRKEKDKKFSFFLVKAWKFLGLI